MSWSKSGYRGHTLVHDGRLTHSDLMGGTGERKTGGESRPSFALRGFLATAPWPQREKAPRMRSGRP